jgi:hypothetical protein
MAKRLRDTARRKLPSYQKLSFKAKGVLSFLEDNCESNGLWPANFELASAELGVKFDEDFLATELSDRVWRVDEDRYFIKTFFEEQYGDAKDTFNAKRAAIATLEQIGVISSDGFFVRPSPDTQPTVDRVSTDTLSRSKSNLNSSKGSAEGKQTAVPAEAELEEIYRDYPSRDDQGKGKGLASLRRQLKTPDDLAACMRAAKNYALYRKGKDREFTKQFKTWCGSANDSTPEWRAWIDWVPDPNPQSANSSRSPPPPVRTVSKLDGDIQSEIDSVLVIARFQSSHSWSEVNEPLSSRARAAVELAGGWDGLKGRPAAQIQDALVRVLNSPTAAKPRSSGLEAGPAKQHRLTMEGIA